MHHSLCTWNSFHSASNTSPYFKILNVKVEDVVIWCYFVCKYYCVHCSIHHPKIDPFLFLSVVHFYPVVTCDVPQPISNGEILYYSGRNFSYSNSIGFVCNDYYEIDGPSSSQCGIHGTWTPEPPVCEPSKLICVLLVKKTDVTLSKECQIRFCLFVLCY